MNNVWRLWAKALGEKACNDNRDSDIVALIRSGIVLLNSMCCVFIIAGIVHHW